MNFNFSLNTPPGTKLRLKGEITVTSGMLHLNTGNVELLGGIVSTLVEKWTMNRVNILRDFTFSLLDN